MDASQLLWEKWQEQVKELFPRLHGHQQKSLALLVAAMVVSGGAVLQHLAETIQQQGWSEAKMSSIERRLERFLANEPVEVPAIWKAFLGAVLPSWQGKNLTFVLDCTPYNAQFTIVYLGLLVHSRVLPVAWTVMPQQEHWEERQWDIVARLLDSVRLFLPETHSTLLADRGLAGAALVRLCQQRQWHDVLRICQEHTCRRQMGKHNPPWPTIPCWQQAHATCCRPSNIHGPGVGYPASGPHHCRPRPLFTVPEVADWMALRFAFLKCVGEREWGPYSRIGGPYSRIGGPYSRIGGPYSLCGGLYSHWNGSQVGV